MLRQRRLYFYEEKKALEASFGSKEGTVNLSRLSNISHNYSIAEPKIGPIFVAFGGIFMRHIYLLVMQQIGKGSM